MIMLTTILTGVALVAMASGASSASGCRSVKGTVTLTTVSGPTCTSAVDVCATGEFTGKFKATTSFTGTSILATADTPTTGVVLLTGDTVFYTANGKLLTKDAITLQTTDDGAFAEVDTIIGGTGRWLGASGILTATGTFTATSGGVGIYQGTVCTP
jgi:hypothetical protein